MIKPLYHAKITQTVITLLVYQFVLYLVPLTILSYYFKGKGHSPDDLSQQIYAALIGFTLLLLWLSRKYRLELGMILWPEMIKIKYFIPMSFTVIGVDIAISELGNRLQIFIPMDVVVGENLMKLFGTETGLFKSFILVVILAPTLEEIVFRGLILRGFLQHYSVKKAVIVSAILFGLFHMNIWQFLGAFAWGIVAGWWFIETRSLFYCIAGHSLMNGIGFIMMLLKDLYNIIIPGFSSDYKQLLFQPPWFTIMGLTLFACGLLMLTQIFKRDSSNMLS